MAGTLTRRQALAAGGLGGWRLSAGAFWQRMAPAQFRFLAGNLGG